VLHIIRQRFICWNASLISTLQEQDEKLSVPYPSLLQPLMHERDMVWLSLTCQKNLVLHQNISCDYISIPYCRKVCMLIVFFSMASSTSFVNILTPCHEFYCILFRSLHGLKMSKAVNKSKTIIGVVRKGHMNGIVYVLISDQGDLRFHGLVGR
jgi:hypothetical protein